MRYNATFNKYSLTRNTIFVGNLFNTIKMKNIYFLGFLLLSTFARLFAQNVPSYVSTSGLIGWWGCNGNAADSSGSGNNGVSNGATLSADRNATANSAYSFNGTSSYIALTNGMSGSLTGGKVSAAAWVFFTSNATWASISGATLRT